MRVILLSLLLAVLLGISVSALGIAPANVNLAFEPSAVKTINYRIYNTQAKAFTARIIVNGTLSDNIKIDHDSISFQKEDRFKTFTATLTFPKKNTGLFADIIVSGDPMNVGSRIEVANPGPLITGYAVRDDDLNTEAGDNRDDNLMLALLIILIMANAAYFIAGRTSKSQMHPKTVEKILEKVKKMDAAKFRKYVNRENNEVAEWLQAINRPALAVKIYDMVRKEDIVNAIESDLLRKDDEKSPSDLKKEITELKRELDTYDFRGFEKDL